MDRTKYQIQIPLPPKIDPTVTMMTVEEKPDVTYSDIGGCKEQVLDLPCCKVLCSALRTPFVLYLAPLCMVVEGCGEVLI